MNVPSDLADKVLQADARNIVKNVGDGSPLTGPQRDLMERHALTPEKAMRDRALAFIDKFRSGQNLTAEQWAEVHAVFPEFKTGAAANAPVAPDAEPAPIRDGFTLTEEPPSKELTRDKLAEYEKLYDRGGRQLRRWWKEGAPLDRPTDMPAWYSRTHKWSVPEPILKAAAAARSAASPQIASGAAEKPAPDPAPPDPTLKASAPPPPPTAPPTGASIDLTEYALRENEDVKQAESLVAVAWQRLQEAYKGGTADVDMLHRRHEKAMETLRKVRVGARADLQQRRMLIPREEVENDRAMAAELLRQMRESMERRVIELCPSLNIEQRDEVAAAIIRVRRFEETILCDPAYLREVKSQDDLDRLFRAA